MENENVNGVEAIGPSACVLAESMRLVLDEDYAEINNDLYPNLQWHAYAARWLIIDLLDNIGDQADPSSDNNEARRNQFFDFYGKVTSGNVRDWVIKDIAVCAVTMMVGLMYAIEEGESRTDKEGLEDWTDKLFNHRRDVIESGVTYGLNLPDFMENEEYHVEQPTPFHFLFDSICGMVSAYIEENIDRYLDVKHCDLTHKDEEYEPAEFRIYNALAFVSCDELWQEIQKRLPKNFLEFGYILDAGLNKQIGITEASEVQTMIFARLIADAGNNTPKEALEANPGDVTLVTQYGWDISSKVTQQYELSKEVLAAY